jgi:hypothetical protein
MYAVGTAGGGPVSADAATTLFDSLCAQLHVLPDRKGEVWIGCPSCGKDRKHFSFNETTGHCFACDYSGSLRQIAALLNIRAEDRPVKAHRKPVQRPEQWQRNPELWLTRYCEAFDRISRWNAYKPLSLDSLAKHRLGLGQLPIWSEQRSHWYDYPHRRLIVPVFHNGVCVAFHGRAFDPADTGAKWLCASGSNKKVLFLTRPIQSGDTLVVVENYVDAMLASESAPDAVYAAMGGASWQEAWTQQVAQARPARVLMWLDHDLAGNGSRYHEAELLALWRQGVEARRAANPALAARPFPTPPEPNGPQIANALLKAGVQARVYQWPKGTPPKADIGSALTAAGAF